MKKLLILLLSLFFLSSPSVFADDISDFEIEGMSIGDSLLDYMTEDEIVKEINHSKNVYSYLKEPNKYAEVVVWKDLSVNTNAIFFFIKNNSTNKYKYVTDKNEKYKIISIGEQIDYIEDFDACIQKRDEIAGELSKMFPNAQKIEKTKQHPADSSGKSIADAISFLFSTGDKLNVYCDNFEESFRIRNNWTEGLNIFVQTKEIASWLGSYK